MKRVLCVASIVVLCSVFFVGVVNAGAPYYQCSGDGCNNQSILSTDCLTQQTHTVDFQGDEKDSHGATIFTYRATKTECDAEWGGAYGYDSQVTQFKICVFRLHPDMLVHDDDYSYCHGPSNLLANAWNNSPMAGIDYDGGATNDGDTFYVYFQGYDRYGTPFSGSTPYIFHDS